MSYLIFRVNGFVPIRVVYRDPQVVCAVMESTFNQEYWYQQIEADEDPELSALRARVAELEKVEEKAVALFQACSDLPLPEMDRMEKEINELAAALKGNANE